VQVFNNAVLGNNCTGIPINSVSMGTGSVQLSE
jgi:hypothetical protein